MNDLADGRKPYDCDNFNFNFKERGTRRRRKCAAIINLPQYPIAEIQTASSQRIEAAPGKKSTVSTSRSNKPQSRRLCGGGSIYYWLKRNLSGPTANASGDVGGECCAFGRGAASERRTPHEAAAA